MENLKLKPKHLGMGIVLFENVINVNQSLIIPFLQSLKDKALKEDYTFIYDDQKKPLYAINRSGHRYSLEDIDKSCNHIMAFLNEQVNEDVKSFFQNCEDTMYQCLIWYAEIFPMILPCLWWRTQGHVVAYGPGATFGLHCDNDINYKPGAEPDQQLAIRNVVGSLIYLNSSVDKESDIIENEYIGGQISFPYAEVEYTPKSGDLIMFPSNYLATHEVKESKVNNRYAYVGYFAQGSEDPDKGIKIRQPSNIIDSGQVWMPEIFNDYTSYVKNKYSNQKDIDRLLKPTKRAMTSHGTNKELKEHDGQ
jgi:predicted 2-oxoglutarate/Fe(II)-dependent dioxygenase YbiX